MVLANATLARVVAAAPAAAAQPGPARDGGARHGGALVPVRPRLSPRGSLRPALIPTAERLSGGPLGLRACHHCVGMTSGVTAVCGCFRRRRHSRLQLASRGLHHSPRPCLLAACWRAQRRPAGPPVAAPAAAQEGLAARVPLGRVPLGRVPLGRVPLGRVPLGRSRRANRSRRRAGRSRRANRSRRRAGRSAREPGGARGGAGRSSAALPGRMTVI